MPPKRSTAQSSKNSSKAKPLGRPKGSKPKPDPKALPSNKVSGTHKVAKRKQGSNQALRGRGKPSRTATDSSNYSTSSSLGTNETELDADNDEYADVTATKPRKQLNRKPSHSYLNYGSDDEYLAQYSPDSDSKFHALEYSNGNSDSDNDDFEGQSNNNEQDNYDDSSNDTNSEIGFSFDMGTSFLNLFQKDLRVLRNTLDKRRKHDLEQLLSTSDRLNKPSNDSYHANLPKTLRAYASYTTFQTVSRDKIVKSNSKRLVELNTELKTCAEETQHLVQEVNKRNLAKIKLMDRARKVHKEKINKSMNRLIPEWNKCLDKVMEMLLG